MIRFLKKLINDRRGNVLIIAGAALPLLVGAAGLATDTVTWAMWKRELQRAADSAAFAGVYAKLQADPNVNAEQAVDTDLAKHNTTGVALMTGYPLVEHPTVHEHAVKVTLKIQRPLGFSSLFLSTPPIITTTATAALVEVHNYCLIGLSPTGNTLNIGGSSYVDMGCGAFSNSEDTDTSVNVMGVDHYFAATVIDSAGGIDGPINGTTNINEEMTPQADPYADLDTSIPDGMPCTALDTHVVSQTGSVGTGDLHVTLEPGCYTNFSTANGLYTLQPGTYYLDSTNLTLQGSTQLVGEGVTIVLTGDNPGRVQNNGTSSFQLTAPTDTTNPFHGLVLVQAANATEGNNNFINGDNGTVIDGGMYFPVGDLTINGNTGQATQCISIVAWTVTFTGNAYVQNDVDDCEAANQYNVTKVRLIA